MAPHRGSFRGRGLSIPRRLTSWEEGPGGVAATAFSSTGSLFLGSAVAPLTAGLTIVRIRGRFTIFLGLVTAAGDGFQGAMGIGIATTAAVTAGIGSIPTPISEQGDETWLYWTPISVHGAVVSSTALGEESKMDIVVDTKAMRKFDQGMSIYAALEMTEIGTSSGSAFFDSRALLKLA